MTFEKFITINSNQQFPRYLAPDKERLTNLFKEKIICNITTV